MPVYLSEMAPTERRGAMSGRNEVMIAVGQLLAFLISEETQKTVEPEALGMPVLESLKSNGAAEPNTPAAVLNGVDVWVPDWNAVLADLDADLAAYQQATGS